jgi:hypothetical protein
MKLPFTVQRRGCGWTRFVSCLTLDSVLTLAIALLPSCLLWHLMAPSDFWQRLVLGTVTFVVLGGSCAGAIMFFAYFITWTTGW